MTLSRVLIFPVCLAALLLMGCPNEGRRDSFDYLRSPVTFRIDPVADNHPFCSDPNTRLEGTTELECQNTRKYRLTWERPEDTVGFTEYRIFVDTTPPNAPTLSWTDVRKDPTLASVIMGGRPSASDSIIFILSSSSEASSTVSRTSPRILRIDTTGRIDSKGVLVFAISTVYGEAGLNGQPRFTYVITNDRFSPAPLQPLFTPHDRSLEIRWSRPRDPTSFFEPGADSGIIQRYVVRIVRGGGAKASIPFKPVISYYGVGGVNRAAEVVLDSFRTSAGAPGLHFYLPDSNRVINRIADDPLDSIKVTVGNLTAKDTLDIIVWAVDAENNTTDTLISNRQFLTDTTQPIKPEIELIAGSVTRNGFAYTFTASRDLIETGTGLSPAINPNANIREYLLSRFRIGSNTPIDSIFKITESQRSLEFFTDTLRYLPPGSQYRITVQAVDSSGHLSLIDSLTVSTLSATFTGNDSLATCPPGFIPIPRGTFELGSNLGGDEAGGGLRKIGNYCIEQYEHRVNGTSGNFQNRVTWEQARDVCTAASPGNGSHLCTEAEWERACEGTESVPLVYGVQSEQRDPGGIRYTCNIGTNDSAMASKIALRNPNCLSYDGVFDMSGNYAEWVLDPHTAQYSGNENDSLIIGQPLTPPTATSERVFRGSHYLNTNLAPSALLLAARCSNRDVPKQLRPRAYPGCIDSLNPMIAVTYVNPKPPRCFTLPDSLRGLTIKSLQPARDTNQILLIIQNRETPVAFNMPQDTAYRGLKPITALMTKRTLAIVTFENSQTSETIVDTLDATEMENASQAGLAAIFAREAAPPWTVRKAGGQYAIRYLYAYSYSQGTSARKYYSNQIIGFRCCSNPVPTPAAKRSAAKRR